MVTLRFGKQLQRDFQRDPEQSFVPREQSAPIGPDHLTARPAPLNHLAACQDRFDAKHMVRGHAVLEAMCSARVKSHVATNRANRLAGWVRRIVQAVSRSGFSNLRVDDSGLDNSDSLVRIET